MTTSEVLFVRLPTGFLVSSEGSIITFMLTVFAFAASVDLLAVNRRLHHRP